MQKQKTHYKVLYLSANPQERGLLQPQAFLTTIVSEEEPRELVERLRSRGFRDKNAGHDWFVMPGSILQVYEVSPKGIKVPWKGEE